MNLYTCEHILYVVICMFVIFIIFGGFVSMHESICVLVCKHLCICICVCVCIMCVLGYVCECILCVCWFQRLQ